MTKSEKAYFTELVNDANIKIKEIFSGTEFQNVFKTREEKKAAILAISNAIEPFAEYLNLEVINVDLRQLDVVKTPRGIFQIYFGTVEEAEEKGWEFWFMHDGYAIVKKEDTLAVAVERR